MVSGPQKTGNLEKAIDKIIVFLIPLPVFLSPSSPYLLANTDVWNDVFALPLIFFMSPIAFFLGMHRLFYLKGYALYVLVPLFLFFLWCLFLALLSSNKSYDSFMYFFQWGLIFIWGLYFLSAFNSGDFLAKAKVFFWGAFFGSFYIFVSGFLELVIFGHLLDNGRMTQNLILKGQYQILVYVPTLLSIAASINIIFYKEGFLNKNRFFALFFAFYYAITFFAVVFTGSREGLLFFVISSFLVFFVKDFRSLFISFLFLLVLFLLLVFILFEFSGFFEIYNVRVIEKFKALIDAPFAGRDIAINNYMQAFINSPVIGSAMLPPHFHENMVGFESKSAHNFYIDILVWSGVIGGFIMFLFFLLVFLRFVLNVYGRCSRVRCFSYKVFIVILMVLLLSNNVNVPLRQPLIIPIFMFLVFMLVRLRYCFFSRRLA